MAAATQKPDTSNVTIQLGSNNRRSNIEDDDHAGLDNETNNTFNRRMQNHAVKDTKRTLVHWIQVIACYIALSLGYTAATLFSRFYYMHGGRRRWVSAIVQSAAFPLLLIPLAACYSCRRRKTIIRTTSVAHSRPFSWFTPKILLFTVFLGLLTGFDDFIYAWGISYISTSVSNLLISSQLAFTAIFACLIVKQSMNFYTLNCILLLVLSSVLVALTTSNQRPEGVTDSQYIIGVLATIGTAALYGLYLPLLELLNNVLRNNRKIVMSFTLVLETQLVIWAIATVVCVLGMAISGDFGAILEEAAEFDVGKDKYWLSLVLCAVTWMMAFVGTAGLIFLTSSLLAGICVTALIPAGVLAPLIFFHEAMNAEKGLAMVLSMWGFSSYLPCRLILVVSLDLARILYFMSCSFLLWPVKFAGSRSKQSQLMPQF